MVNGRVQCPLLVGLCAINGYRKSVITAGGADTRAVSSPWPHGPLEETNPRLSLAESSTPSWCSTAKSDRGIIYIIVKLSRVPWAEEWIGVCVRRDFTGCDSKFHCVKALGSCRVRYWRASRCHKHSTASWKTELRLREHLNLRT